MTLEAPSIPRNNTPEDKFEAQQIPVIRNELHVPERPATAEPTQPYLTGNWEVTETLENGLTRISDNSGDIATYRDLTAEELNDYIATDQEAAAARATARAEKLAEQDPITDDERREDLANLYQYLAETTPTEEVATKAKSGFGRKVLRYFTERDPETGEFSYGSGSLTRSGRAARSEQSTSIAETEQPTPEQTSERPSRRERIKNMISAMSNKLSRNEAKRQMRAEAKAHKLEAKAHKAWAKSDLLYDKVQAKEEAALEDEAYRQNEIADAHVEAEVMDTHYEEDHKMWEEAKALMEADFEGRAEAEREAELQAGRDKIHAATKAKIDKILSKAIAEAEKKQAKGAKKEQNYKGDKNRIRSRIAQSLMTINRQ